MLEHGGRLLQAVQRYGVPRQRWLDLSTGINPIAWQGAPLPIASWNRLPEDEDGLLEAAESYYGAARAACPSAARKPRFRRCRGCEAGLVSGCRCSVITSMRIVGSRPATMSFPCPWRLFGAAVDELDVLVVCNPNNPTGERVVPAQLLEWHARLSARGGWLVDRRGFRGLDAGNQRRAFHRP